MIGHDETGRMEHGAIDWFLDQATDETAHQ